MVSEPGAIMSSHEKFFAPTRPCKRYNKQNWEVHVERFEMQENPNFTKVVAARELARFFRVARAREGAFTPMPACPVDSFWHEFQSEGEAFSAFCSEHVDGAVAHRECKGYGRIEWVDAYHSMFRERLPAIWFYSPDGQSFDREGWEAYRAGQIRLSWDCTPEIAPSEPVPGPSATIGGDDRQSPGGRDFDQDGWDTDRAPEVRLSWDCTPEITPIEAVPGRAGTINSHRRQSLGGRHFDGDGADADRASEVRLSWDCTPEITRSEPVPDPSIVGRVQQAIDTFNTADGSVHSLTQRAVAGRN